MMEEEEERTVAPATTITNSAGSHQLFVTSLHKEHLLHSWSVKLESERAAFAECIVLKPNGNLVVSDLLNKKVKEFDKTGKLVSCIGDDKGQSLKSPRGVAILPGNRTAVADPQANSIKVFDANGKFSAKIKGEHLDLPCDLVVSPYNKELFISTDEGKKLVWKQTESSEEVQSVEGIQFEMRRPGCMVLTSSGSSLILCDEVSSCMHVLDATTHDLQQTITLSGNNLLHESGNQCTPAGACVDIYGFLYVADTNNNRILVFDEDMEVRGILHTADWFNDIRMRKDVEEMRMTLSGPVGVAVNDAAELCVLEQAGRVKVFKHFLDPPRPQVMKLRNKMYKKSGCCTIV